MKKTLLKSKKALMVLLSVLILVTIIPTAQAEQMEVNPGVTNDIPIEDVVQPTNNVEDQLAPDNKNTDSDSQIQNEGDSKTTLNQRSKYYNPPQAIGAKYEYDDLKRITKVIFEDGTFYEILKYDALDREMEINDNGIFIFKDFDDTKKTTTTSIASKHSKKDAYSVYKFTEHEPNEFNSVLTCENTSYGDKTISEYDAMDNLTKEQDKFGTIKVYIYDKNGNKIKQIDKYSSKIGINDPAAKLYKYDSNGNCIEQNIPVDFVNGKPVYMIKKSDYNNDDKQIESKTSCNAIGQPEMFTSTKYEYDKDGNMLVAANYDVNGRISDLVQYYYNEKGGLVRTYTGLSDKLTINGLDKVIPGLDKEYNVTKYEYSKDGLLLKEIDPLGKETKYKYNDNGYIKEYTDRNGNKHVYKFQNDGVCRKSEEVFFAGNNSTKPDSKTEFVEKEFYGSDMLQKTILDGKVNTVEYSEDFNPSKEVDQNGITREYKYNDSFMLETLKIKDKSGNIISDLTNKYNERNQLTEVFENGSTVPVVSYKYDDNGRKLSETLENGTKTEYEYNLGGFTTRVKITSKDGGTISDYNYKYKTNAQLEEVKDSVTGKRTKYVYDGRGRIQSEENFKSDKSIEKIEYGYDDNNNRNSLKKGLEYEKNSFDKNNRLFESDGQKIKYDNNGNMIQNGTEQYKYNANNKLIEYSDGSNTIGYEYDGNDKLSSRTLNGKTQFFVWVLDQLVAVINDDGTSQQIIRGGNSNAVKIEEDENAEYMISNYRGDVLATTDENSRIVSSQEFDAFGNPVLKQEEKTDMEFGYTGELYDPVNNLLYLRARFYSPKLGVFITEDSFTGLQSEPESLNRYAYCEQDPTNRTDPGGNYGSHDVLFDEAVPIGGSFSSNIEREIVKTATKEIDGVLHYAKPKDFPAPVTNHYGTGMQRLEELFWAYYNRGQGGLFPGYGNFGVSSTLLEIRYREESAYHSPDEYFKILGYVYSIGLQIKKGYNRNDLNLRGSDAGTTNIQYQQTNFELLMYFPWFRNIDGQGWPGAQKHALMIFGAAAHLAADTWAHKTMVTDSCVINTNPNHRAYFFDSNGNSTWNTIEQMMDSQQIAFENINDFAPKEGTNGAIGRGNNLNFGFYYADNTGRVQDIIAVSGANAKAEAEIRFGQAKKAVTKLASMYNSETFLYGGAEKCPYAPYRPNNEPQYNCGAGIGCIYCKDFFTTSSSWTISKMVDGKPATVNKRLLLKTIP